jgi:hypothetical protein
MNISKILPKSPKPWATDSFGDETSLCSQLKASAKFGLVSRHGFKQLFKSRAVGGGQMASWLLCAWALNFPFLPTGWRQAGRL